MSALLTREPNVWTVQLQRNDGEVIDSFPFTSYWSPPEPRKGDADGEGDYYAARGNVTPDSIAAAAAVMATVATKPNPKDPKSSPRHSFEPLSAVLSGGPAFERRYGSEAGDADEPAAATG